jgi:hypothetical protein
MLATASVTGAPLIAGHVPAGSVEATLPPWLIAIWGGMLLTGSVTALAGSHWRGDYANGLTIERVGLILCGTASLCYATIILSAFAMAGLLAGGIIFGFGAASLTRATDIGIIIGRATDEVTPGKTVEP